MIIVSGGLFLCGRMYCPYIRGDENVFQEFQDDFQNIKQIDKYIHGKYHDLHECMRDSEYQFFQDDFLFNLNRLTNYVKNNTMTLMLQNFQLKHKYKLKIGKDTVQYFINVLYNEVDYYKNMVQIMNKECSRLFQEMVPESTYYSTQYMLVNAVNAVNAGNAVIQ